MQISHLSTIKDLNSSDKMEISNFTSKLRGEDTGHAKLAQDSLILSAKGPNATNSGVGVREKEVLPRIIESAISHKETPKTEEISSQLYSSDVLSKIQHDFDSDPHPKTRPKFEGFDSQARRAKLTESEAGPAKDKNQESHALSLKSIMSPPSQKSFKKPKKKYRTKSEILKRIRSKRMPVLFKVKALYDFKGEMESDLPFKRGDMIKVFGKSKNGWWLGQVAPNGSAGYFPSNFVEKEQAKGPSASGKLKGKRFKRDVYRQKYSGKGNGYAKTVK